MATSSFFYGGSSAPEQNTVDELIDALNQKVAAADQDKVAAEQARDRAETAATNSQLSESNVAGLASQAQDTLSQAQTAVTAANAAVAGTTTNAATATTKAAEAASSATAADVSADAALASQNAAATSATAAATSASTATTQATAAGTSATNAASSASAAAGSATTAATQATNASNSATAAAGSASAASTSASNAASSASAASSSASSASSSATSASTSAATATTKASEAASSASAAATSASNAATSATSASGSATTAATQATNASSSATAAATSASSASTSATNAANSATAAGTSASNAATSASAASTSASQASTSATNAASSASAASGSASTASAAATAAQAAKTAAEAVYDNFDDRYLGAKASAPTVDNDGNALVTGALYFNSTLGQMAAWNGSSWGAIGSNPDSVLGPASSTDNAIARFDGTTGKLVQNSTATVSDTGDAVFKSVNFNDPVHGSRTLSMSSGRLVVDGDFDTVGTYRFGNGWCSLSGGNADGVTLAQLSNGTGNFVLQPNSTGIVEARSGTNPIRFRLYNTYTDASNYERGFIRWNTNAFQIGTEKAGTGSPRNIELVRDGSVVGSIYESYGNIFEFYGTLQSSRVVASGPGDFTIIGYQAAAGLNGAFVSSAGLVGWGSTANPNNGVDTALARDSAATIKITNGSTGLGSLKAANIDFTGNLTKNGTPFSGGAKGGGTDAVFYENDKNVTASYTIGTNKNAMTTGPISINSGVSVTVPSGSRWVVL